MIPTLILDCEVYRDYFLAAFRNVETGNVRCLEMYEGQPIDLDTLRGILRKYRIVTFNGNNYDLPIVTEALQGADCARLKRVSDRIIVENVKPWQMGIEPVGCNHIDIFDVAPGMASLKIYGGRLHCPRMQDLPIEPDASISPEQRDQLRTYCVNDLETTQALFLKLMPQIELREKMSETYGIDLRSKSDAQIAEAVIASEVGKLLGSTVKKPEGQTSRRFRYKPPAWVSFTTEPLKEVLALADRVEFFVPDSGKVELPVELAKAAIRIGNGVYRMGIGGLHSSEQTVSHYADENTVLIDRDVTSYYPTIILNNGWAPAHMGEAFSRVYRRLVERRVEAKKAGDTVTADSLKITVNGSFGKLGSKWSKLYSPDLMIQTTLTGQLALLMLIEAIEREGIQVVSANTDGVTIKCPSDRQALLAEVVAGWEAATGFGTEETRYSALHSRDINNFLAFKEGEGVKLKGAYAPPGLQKNPTNVICVMAVLAFLKDNVPIAQTIRTCTDIRQFVTIRQVAGGAIDQSGAYLGKAVRWYYATGVEGPLTYKSNGYTVARSEGARAVMQLPESLPDDVDYEWYEREALSILADVGVDPAHYAVRDLV